MDDRRGVEPPAPRRCRVCPETAGPGERRLHRLVLAEHRRTLPFDGSYVSSLSQKSSDRSLHNLALRYTSAFGLDLGLDYTHYDNPEQSRLENSYADGSATAFDVARDSASTA